MKKRLEGRRVEREGENLYLHNPTPNRKLMIRVNPAHTANMPQRGGNIMRNAAEGIATMICKEWHKYKKWSVIFPLRFRMSSKNILHPHLPSCQGNEYSPLRELHKRSLRLHSEDHRRRMLMSWLVESKTQTAQVKFHQYLNVLLSEDHIWNAHYHNRRNFNQSEFMTVQNNKR